MRTQIKGLWMGMIPVRDVFVNKAIRLKEDLIVEVGNERYVIKNELLKSPRIIKPVKDNFSSKMQKLLYYGIVKTEEEDKQLRLL